MSQVKYGHIVQNLESRSDDGMTRRPQKSDLLPSRKPWGLQPIRDGHPVPRMPQHLLHVRLQRPGTWMEVILPPRGLGQRHQDGLHAAARHRQAELGAAIVHKVELHVTPPAHLLPPLLLLSVRQRVPALHDGHVAGNDGLRGSDCKRTKWATARGSNDRVTMGENKVYILMIEALPDNTLDILSE